MLICVKGNGKSHYIIKLMNLMFHVIRNLIKSIFRVVIVICLLIFICLMGCCVFGFLYQFVQGRNGKSETKETKKKKTQTDTEAQTEKRVENENSTVVEQFSHDETIRAYSVPPMETKC